MKKGECYLEKIGAVIAAQYNIYRIEEIDPDGKTCEVEAFFFSGPSSEEGSDYFNDFDDAMTIEELNQLRLFPAEVLDEFVEFADSVQEFDELFEMVNTKVLELFPDMAPVIMDREEAARQLKQMGYEAAKYWYEVLTERGKDKEYQEEYPEDFLPDGRPTAESIGEAMNSDFYDTFLGSLEEDNPEIFEPYGEETDFIGKSYFDGFRDFEKEKY